MKLLRGALVLILSYALGVQPAVAQMQTSFSASAASGVGGAAAASALGGSSAGAIQFRPLALAPAALLSPSLFAPTFNAAPSFAAAAHAAMPASFAQVAPAAVPADAPVPRLVQIRVAADKAVEGLERVSGGALRGKADAQFAALTNERLAAASDGVEPPSSEKSAGHSARAPLDKPDAAVPPPVAEKTDVPAPKPAKSGFFQVFSDPNRNKSFWRYVLGNALFSLGFEMYMVGNPYLISSMTTNALNEKHDSRAANQAAVTELIRSNRSLSRIAHWAAQFLSYVTIPLFTRNAEKDGPKKWLVRSMLIRGAVLAGISGLFFATGILGLTGSMWLLFGLVAAQSFFQGIAVTAEGVATTRLFGDKSVSDDERDNANSILTRVGAIIAIIGPVLAGQISRLGPIFGKSGVGGAVIYAVYAGLAALTGLIYAGIKMFGGPSKDAAASPADGKASVPAPKGFRGTLSGLWTSIKAGTRIVLKDRLLRTMLLITTVSSLFSDPLVFNVLPEYIDGLVAKNPITSGAIGQALLHIPLLGPLLSRTLGPVLGALVHGLTATPMGNFALMIVMASIGSIVASYLIKPLKRFFQKRGFKTDAALTIPFYWMAALEAPLFILMIVNPSVLAAVGLYGLQALVTGFIGISISSLYQKNLGNQKPENVNKILAADSLIGIAAAIVSTFVYGFVLTGIPIGTSLVIAAVATGAMSVLHLFAPFLSFSKAQRKPPEPDSSSGDAPPTSTMHLSGIHQSGSSIHSIRL